MDKEIELLKAFNLDDRQKITLINSQAIKIAALEPMISSAKAILETPAVQESAERLLVMDKELKTIGAYHLMLSAISALRDINKSLPDIPARWLAFFGQKFPTLSEVPSPKPKFAQNCAKIRQVFEQEIVVFEGKALAVIDSLPVQPIEVGRGAE